MANSALKAYRDKRDFTRTAEPKGKLAAKAPAGLFVIQKHDATRLHFDFRLELDGVLKSWAVTRGPSLNPADKRLAVEVEDHPVDYASFEGTIPKGEYGGGTVMLWDEGTWRPQGDPHEGLKKGVLKIELDGQRLKGGFALVRLPRKGKEKRNNWLLIKERDRYAEPDGDPLARWTKSVSTRRTMAQIAAGDPDPPAAKKRGGKRTTKSTGKRTGKSRPPQFVAPQLATLVTKSPAGNHWFNEIKYDGYRALGAIGGGRARIYTRSGQDWSAKFPAIAQALTRLDVGSALLDGEIVVLDDEGRSSFARLQHGLKAGKVALTYYVFDLLELDGRDLRKEPLSRRKELLEKLLAHAPDCVRYSGHVVGHADELFAKACRLGLEGIVSKRSDAPYVSKRTKSWLKIKCTGNDEFVIGGYRVSDKKGRAFASLLIGEFDGKELHYRGRVGTGFDEQTLKDLGARFKKLQRKTCPFVDVPASIAKDARWVEPRLVAQIAFTERTRDDLLRHPAFEGLRGDKPARQVQSRTSHAMKTKTPTAPDADPDLAGVSLTSPNKVLFPEAQITKEELARYLLVVSEPMLTHVRGRLASLVRCPEGTDGDHFFQKHPAKGMPSQFTSVPVKEADGKSARYLMLDDPAALVAAAQIGALEIHIWGSHYAKLEYPDRLVFDLDPDGGLTFADVKAAARDIRDLLQAAGLTSFPLVTGGKGIHVVVPLDASQDWDEVKGFAKGVARRLASNEPGRFTATMSKAKRKGRIFIDYLRNERGSTAIAPYSPRARSYASVAVPVSWTELGRIDSADAFRIPDVERRLRQKKTDPWKGYFATRQRISRKALDFFA